MNGKKLVYFGLAFGLVETAFFGWNWTPVNNAEAICDHIALFLTYAGYVLIWRTKNEQNRMD